MYRRYAAAIVLLALLTGPLSAKGPTLKITIKGDALKSPIELTEPGIREFEVWAGAGVTVNGVPQQEGFIIDWPKGILAERPDGIEIYEVWFHVEHQQQDSRYVVKYAYEPSQQEGFVYLPARQDEFGRSNTSLIWRKGFEGNWLRSTAKWDEFARPIIESAKTGDFGAR
jgi:hypothetical protein